MVYNCTSGNESVLSSRLQIIKNSFESYTIIFVQEGFFPEYFQEIEPYLSVLISKEQTDTTDTEEIITRKIILKIKAVNNIKVENLFKLSKS